MRLINEYNFYYISVTDMFRLHVWPSAGWREQE